MRNWHGNLSPFGQWHTGGRAFSPAVLFAFGEQGVWFDPSDVANLNWRRNLLTWTQEFDNAAWVKAGLLSVSANVAVAPDGTTTADKVTNDSSTGFHRISVTAQNLSATNYSLSVYMKAAEYTSGALSLFDNVAFVARSTFDLSAGTVSINSGSATIESVGNGWYRCTVTGVCSATTTPYISVNSPFTYTGDGTSGILIWGAQLELGSVATTYQPITTVDAGTIERFPNATLYQDTTGTQPVTTPGQSVGLMLDRSRGLALGPELVTNGDFGTGDLTGFTSGGGWAVSGGAARLNSNNGAFYLRPTVANTNARWLTFTVVSGSTGSIDVRGTSPAYPVIATFASPGTYTVFIAAGVEINFLRTSATFNGGLDNISVKELPGNHATQTTPANRPIYAIEPQGGRRNLLVRTEEFENASWGRLDTTVTANTATAPDGTTTADLLSETALGGVAHLISQTLSYVSGVAYTISAYLKKGSGATAPDWMQLTFGSAVFGASQYANFNLTTGLVGTVVGGSATIQSVGSGWYRVSFTATATSTASAPSGIIFNNNSDSSGRVPPYTGATTSNTLIWGAQLETGSTATPYQKVTTQYDVTEAGVPSMSYLFFNGLNFSMATPSINFPAGPTNPTLGPELVTNGNFATDTAWTKGTGWTISGGSANFASGADNSDLVQSIGLPVIGTTYRITLSQTWTSGGQIRAIYGNQGYNLPAASGTYTFFLTASSAAESNIRFRALAGASVISIDNISVREIDAAQAPDNMSVFAGVRKLSDAAAGMLVESSATVVSNSGSFNMLAPNSTGASGNFAFYSKGANTPATPATSATTLAPVTAVLTGIGDISGDLMSIRTNGAVGTNSTLDQGAGNYLAYPLYIGSRNSASLFFSGHLYSLIVRGAQSTTTQITNTEAWVAGETGFFAPIISGVPTVGIS